MAPDDFRSLLEATLRADPARPLVTFYDDATGERVELSAATYANWVSKTAGLVRDELDLERGDLVLLDLPTHWLGPVWLGAIWTGGQCATDDRDAAADAALVVCGPDGLQRYRGLAAERPVVALSLRPFGARFTEPLPEGVVDYGAVVLAQPDVFVPDDPATGDDPAWRGAEGTTTQRELLTAASAAPLVTPGGRLLTDTNPCSAAGLATLLSPLQAGGGTVWVTHPDPDAWAARYDAERATAQLRLAGS